MTLNTTHLEIPLTVLVPFLSAISDRDWETFRRLGTGFLETYDVEIWKKFFGSRLKPALDEESYSWVSTQWTLCVFQVNSQIAKDSE